MELSPNNMPRLEPIGTTHKGVFMGRPKAARSNGQSAHMSAEVNM